MELNELSYKIIGCIYKVHAALGPGLLESTYEVCLEHEILKCGLLVERQKILPVVYDGLLLEAGYRIDILVENRIILELKCHSGLRHSVERRSFHPLVVAKKFKCRRGGVRSPQHPARDQLLFFLVVPILQFHRDLRHLPNRYFHLTGVSQRKLQLLDRVHQMSQILTIPLVGLREE
jgi:GxxExxY protein